MSKRPFSKIRRIEKKENLESAQPKIEENNEQQIISKQNITRPPKFSLEKKKILISNADAPDTKQETNQPQIKTSLGSKPILFRGKRDGAKLIINSNRNAPNEQPTQQNHAEAPKPTPMAIKKRIGLAPKIKQTENIVIQEEESVPKLDFQESKNFNVEESKNFNVEQSNNFRRKPDLKIKRFMNKKPNSQKVNDYEETAELGQPKEQELRYEASMAAPIQYRQINIEPTKLNLSQGKIEKQRKRTSDLKNLLNLQIDLYEQTLSISSITSYEIYINKIKSAFLKNSNDQAFDDKVDNSCQTSSFQYNDFMNQCPQDYSLDINSIEKIDDNQMFNQFVLKVASVIEQLIKPNTSITQPPIFLLAFRPTFKAFLKCPYPIFIYRSEEYHLDLLVIGEKLYITQGQIESVLMIDKNIVAGLKSGHIVLWNGQNNKSSRLYKQIHQFTQTTNFQLPSYSTHDLQKFSSYLSEFSIVSLIHQERSQFSSLDATGKIVRWAIEDTINGSQIVRPLGLVQLRNLTQHWALVAFCLKRRNQAYYINTSVGLIFLHNQEIKQILDTEGLQMVTFQVPKKTPLVYVICDNNSLMIFNELYSHKLFEMPLQIGTSSLKQIILPDLEHDNRQIIILFVAYLVDSLGRIFEVRLLQNKVQFLQKSNEDDPSDRKDKNVIFKGVNKVGEFLETIKLMRDLKITTSANRINVNMQKTVPNLKSILQKNRQIMTLLEYQNVVIY